MTEQLEIELKVKAGAAAKKLFPVYPVTKQSSLGSSIGAYQEHLKARNRSDNTIESYTRDILKIISFFGDQLVVSLSEDELERLVAHMRDNNKAKTVSRCVDTMKSYFGWLHGKGIIEIDPAEKLSFRHVVTPLPEILTAKEYVSFIEASKVRPWYHLLVLICLETGVKRSELSQIRPKDIEFSNFCSGCGAAVKTGANFCSICGKEIQMKASILLAPGHPRKARKFAMSAGMIQSYKELLDANEIGAQDKPLFDYTERGLNKALSILAGRAGIPKGKRVSVQTLRDTFAVRKLVEGMSEADLLVKLGLAPKQESGETLGKYLKLAELSKDPQ